MSMQSLCQSLYWSTGVQIFYSTCLGVPFVGELATGPLHQWLACTPPTAPAHVGVKYCPIEPQTSSKIQRKPKEQSTGGFRHTQGVELSESG